MFYLHFLEKNIIMVRYLWVYTWHGGIHAVVRRQLCGVSLLPPLCGVQASVCQASTEIAFICWVIQKPFMCILLFVFLALFSLLSPHCNKNSDQKQLKGGKVYFSLRLQVQSIAEGQKAWLLGHISLLPAKELCFIARSTAGLMMGAAC